MSKSVPFVASLAGVLTVLTYYAVPLLVASESLRKNAPHVAASMERMVRGLHDKTLYCTEDETAPKPDLITPRQVISLADEVDHLIRKANRHNNGVASKFVSEHFESTTSMSRLYSVGSSFSKENYGWYVACEKGTLPPETKEQLRQDLREMEDTLSEYRAATERHGRGVVRIRILAAVLLGLDLSVAIWIVSRFSRRTRRPVANSSEDAY